MYKHYFKQLLSVVLALVMAISIPAFSFSSAAAVRPEFTVTDIVGSHFGDIVSVDIVSSGVGSYMAGQFFLYYDTAVMTPVSIEAGNASGAYFVGNEAYSNGVVSFSTMNSKPIQDAGVLAKVTFEITGSVLIYSGVLDLKVKDLLSDVPLDYSYKEITATVNDGNVYASAVLTVPEANDPSALEILGLYPLGNDYMVTGRTWFNLTASALDTNFDEELERTYFSKNGVILSADDLLTTGCYFTVGDGFFTEDKVVVSVRGDVDGDYNSNGYDAFLASAVACGALTDDNFEIPNLKAADADNNGTADQNDVNMIEQNALE